MKYKGQQSLLGLQLKLFDWDLLIFHFAGRWTFLRIFPGLKLEVDCMNLVNCRVSKYKSFLLNLLVIRLLERVGLINFWWGLGLGGFLVRKLGQWIGLKRPFGWWKKQLLSCWLLLSCFGLRLLADRKRSFWRSL